MADRLNSPDPTSLGGLSLDRGFVGPGMLVDQADGSISPVRVHSNNNYCTGVFVTDTLDITPRLAATVSARFNSAQIRLADRLGTRLNGANNAYNRLNPAAGFTYKLLPEMTFYAGYSETNRAPTPAELSCADPPSPCSLTNFFVGDPDLAGSSHTPSPGWSARRSGATRRRGGNWTGRSGCSGRRATTTYFSLPVKTIGRAFFRNVGETRRQGLDMLARLRAGRRQTYAGVHLHRRTFRSAFTLSSENNPLADPSGDIQVRRGDQLPGVPRHIFKTGADYAATDAWIVGFSVKVASGQYLFGDEFEPEPENRHLRGGQRAHELSGHAADSAVRPGGKFVECALRDVWHVFAGGIQYTADPGARRDRYQEPQSRSADWSFRRRAGDAVVSSTVHGHRRREFRCSVATHWLSGPERPTTALVVGASAG